MSTETLLGEVLAKVEQLKPERWWIRVLELILPAAIALVAVWLTASLAKRDISANKAAEVYAEKTLEAATGLRKEAYQTFKELDGYFATFAVDPTYDGKESHASALDALNQLRDAINSYPFRNDVYQQLKNIHSETTRHYESLQKAQTEVEKKNAAKAALRDLPQKRGEVMKVVAELLPQ